MKKVWSLSAVAASVVLLVGCGGGGSSSVSSVVETGKAYYLDSAVAGVNYTCGTHEGVTGANGEFTFEVGQSCTFYIGDVKLRDMDKALLSDGAKIVEDDLKVAALLQSLDSDGNPDNGITLTAEVVAAFSAAVQENGNEGALPSTQEELEAVVASIENNVTEFSGHAVTQEQAQSHLEATQTALQMEATKALLAGKSFYTVDEANDGSMQVTQLIFNEDTTSIKAISPEETEEWGITIDGNKLVFSDNDDGSYTLISQADGYIYFDDRYADGSKDGEGHRLYEKKADAEAYLNTITKEVTFSGHIMFKNSNGITILKPEKAKIEIRPAHDVWDPKIEIEINSDGSFETTVRVLKELFDSDSSFRFVVYGDTNNNNNWDGDSGEINNNGILENDIRYYDNDVTFNGLNSIVVVVN